VLELDAKNQTSLRAVSQLHHRASRWNDVVASLKQQLELSDDADERAAILHRIARIYERKIGRREEAIANYRAAAEHVGFLPAFRSLDRLLRRDRLWTDLTALLRGRATTAATDEKAELLCAIGQIEELHLGDFDAADRAYSDALALKPKLEGAILSRAQV